MILTLIEIYAALLIVVILHEMGHCPKKIKIIKWFPIPEGVSYQARYRYGGLLMNTVIFLFIWKFQPENTFLQLIGLVAYLHLIFYMVVGSFNREINTSKITPSMLKHIIFDDIPNELAPLFVSLAVIIFYYFKDYYIPILVNVIQNFI